MFLVFAGHDDGRYRGGWYDRKNHFFHEEIAIKYAERIVSDYDWVHVVDLDSDKIIWERQN